MTHLRACCALSRAHPPVPRFAPPKPPEPDISDNTSRSISTASYRYQGRFTLQVSAESAAERIAPTTGALERVDDYSCTCAPA